MKPILVSYLLNKAQLLVEECLFTFYDRKIKEISRKMTDYIRAQKVNEITWKGVYRLGI